MEPVVKTYIC